ncbi:MAG: peptidyl-prolyl cis-trans isomerase [bacterium]
MRKRNLNRLIVWAIPAVVVAGGLVGATTLLAQGMRPAAPKPKAAPKAAMKPAGMAAGMAAKPEAGKPVIPPKDAKLELAKVGDITITVGDLALRINRMSRYVRGRYESLEKKRALLDSMIEFEVLAKEAARRGFDKHPDVVRMLRQVMIQRLRQKVVEDKVKREDIKDVDIKGYYEKHKAQYNKPETVRVSHILLRSKGEADAVLKEVKAKGNDPRAFRELVKKHSTDEATKRRAGDLRYFTKDDKRVPKEVVDAAFKLEKRGDVGGPVKSRVGWHVIKLTHRRTAINRSVDDAKVKQQIVTRILRDRRREALESFKKDLRAKATVKIHDEQLKAVKIDTTIQQRGGFRGPHGQAGKMRGMRPGRMGGRRPGQLGPRGRGMGPRGSGRPVRIRRPMAAPK